MKQDAYDFEYAHTLLVECVTRDPGNVTYIEAFFENLRRKYKNNKRGSLLSFGGKGPLKKALAKEQWAEVLKVGPPILKSNPWDVATLRGLARACAASGLPDAELRYLRYALEPNPNDVEVNRHCAQSLTRVGRYDQAIGCWNRVDEFSKGGDREAQENISQLQIEKTQAGARLGKGPKLPQGTRSSRATSTARPARTPATPSSTSAKSVDAAQDVENPQPTTSPRREIRLTPRQQLEQALVLNPTDIDTYFELVQLHVAESRLGEAVHVLERAQAATGNDIRVQEKMEDVEVLRKKRQLVIAEQQAERAPTPDAQQLVTDLRDDLRRYELQVFMTRAQRYPQDAECQFQLGMRLKWLANYREAMRCFELAAQLPARRAAATLERAECLQHLRQYAVALDCYETAIGQAAEATQTELLKLALYRSAVLAAALRDESRAIERFTQLIDLDPGYKDAAERLDKIRGMGHIQ